MDYIRKEEDCKLKNKTNKNVAMNFISMLCDLKDPSGLFRLL